MGQVLSSYSPIRAVLFDKDGTLIDFAASWGPVMAIVAAELAPDDPALARRLLEIGGHDPDTGHTAPGSLLAAGTSLEIADGWLEPLGHADREALAERIDAGFQRHCTRYVTAVPRLRETLTALRARDLCLGVATSDSAGAAHAGLGQLGLVEMFASIYGYDSGRGTKPGPGMVLAFCADHGFEPAEVAVVGDNTHDLEMAHAAGAGLAIGVLTGTGRPEDLAPLAHHVLPGLAELPALLAAR